ncbi:MAG: hypothetical protein CMH54_07520 [Myxococcales bacterium]|nr:hypothetical protein [Myxococcales bacterium]|tara:strand:- start:326 stop:1543 length:1218 start_codon:yes stop_codon:yes gene_type:complete
MATRTSHFLLLGSLGILATAAGLAGLRPVQSSPGEQKASVTLAIHAATPDDLHGSTKLSQSLSASMQLPFEWEGDSKLHTAAWSVLRFTHGIDHLHVDGVLQEALEGAGVVDAMVIPIQATGHSQEDILAQMEILIRRKFHHLQFNRLGIACEKTDSTWRALVLLTRRQLELPPPKQQIDKEGVYRLRGTLLVPTSNVQVLVLQPDGLITERTAEVFGSIVSTDIIFPMPGRYQVEVILPDLHGAIPAALTSVDWQVAQQKHGTKPKFTVLPTNATASPGDSAQLQIIQATNQLRADYDRPPLTRDQRLETLAHQHARELSNRRLISHLDDSGRDVATRLRAAGIHSKQVGENVAAGLTLASIHRSLVQSPSHRRELLRANFDKIGVGIVRRNGVLFVVELLTGL